MDLSNTNTDTPKKSLVRDEGGRVYTEFVSVVLVFLVLIFTLTQQALLFAGGLAVQRSAATAARAAMVVLDDDPQYYGGQGRNNAGGARGAAIELAASFPLYALKTSAKASDTLEHAFRSYKNSPYAQPNGILPGLTVTYPSGTSSRRGDLITVLVEYEFPCEVPIGRVVLCRGGTLKLEAESTLPNMSADYDYGQW